MNMTHYMELLASNQPWNLLAFMAVPVILAETLAITELVVLFRGSPRGLVGTVNRWAAISVGAYFAVVFVYLVLTAVVPLTREAAWRGPADVIAVGFYLFGLVPLGGVALIEVGLLAARWPDRRRLALHVGFVALFLVTAHVAMIAGMLDPTVLQRGGAMPASQAHVMPDHAG